MTARTDSTVSTRGGPRRYSLFTPPGESRGAVLFLGGTGGTTDFVLRDTRVVEATLAAGYTAAVPEGLPPDPSKPAKFLTNPPRWNDGSRYDAPAMETTADDVSFLAELILALNLGPVRLAGFSNGAGMAFRLAAERPDLVTSLVAVAGYCWVDPPLLANPIPTAIVLGTADPLIPLAGGPVRLPWLSKPVQRPPYRETAERWAAANGASLTPAVAEVAEGYSVASYPGAARTEFHIIQDHGHHWPGGRGLLGEKLGGPNRTPSPLDAAGLVLGGEPVA